MMKSKIMMLMMAVIATMIAACTSETSGPKVTAPSWKGFNYVVKRDLDDGTTEQVERGAIKPTDEIKVYAVRKNKGVNVGQINGTIYVRYTAYMKEGAPKTEILDKSVTSLANDNYDGWEDPYATFTMPEVDGEYEYYRVDVACQLYFKTFGNQNSELDFNDNTSHMDPYLGNIYTVNMDPLNGGSANSGTEGSGLKYHTIYTYNSNE